MLTHHRHYLGRATEHHHMLRAASRAAFRKCRVLRTYSYQSLASSPLQPTMAAIDPLTALQIPPSGPPLGPRVEHFLIEDDTLLSTFLCDKLSVPEGFALELMRFGAVYHSPVMPMPNDSTRQQLGEAQMARILAARAGAMKTFGTQVPRRMLADQQVVAGGYLRVHVHPKRFPACYQVDWPRRVVHVGEEYVVVNKPAGVQVAPTVDNLLESVLHCTEQALSLPSGSLSNPHRLDTGTEGLLVLARSSSFARYFSLLLQHKGHEVRKLYRCATTQPPPLGRHVHYVSIGQRRAGEPAHTVVHSSQTEGSSECVLEVLKVEQVALSGAAAQQWGAAGYEATIELVTGRTHQIRAQLAALGCPLLGDSLYEALVQRQQEEQAAAAAGAASSCGAASQAAGGGEESSDAAAAQVPKRHKADTSKPSEASAGEAAPHTAQAQEQEQPQALQHQHQQHDQAQEGNATSQQQHTAAQQQQHLQHSQAAHADVPQNQPSQSQAGHQQPQAVASQPPLPNPPPQRWSSSFQEDPSRAIALQAFRLEVHDDGGRMGACPAVFEAGDPWWRAV